LMNLSGQEYVDIYAATLKEAGVPATRDVPGPPVARIPESAAG